MREAITAALAAREPGLQLRRALESLLKRDRYLLEVDANERTITARLALYLQAEIPNWHVDCEYNRDGIEPKRLGHLELDPNSEDTEARTVFPDIVVHERGTSNNYLVLELKKSSNTVSRDIDFSKLRGYRSQLKYKHAVFIEVEVGNEPDVALVEWVDA